MKKLLKSAAVFMALAIMTVATFGLAACEDIKKLELSLSVYDYGSNDFYAESDVKFSVDLYRHLAPKTVDKVLEHVKAGYYDNAIFYQETGYSSQIMMGDLKIDENGKIVQNLIDGKLPSEIYGEFEAGGTTGSNLVSSKGSIGIWRSYYESDGSYTVSSDARDSGRATWYIPTAEISGYNGYFCIFAQYDASATANAKAISAISSILSSNSTDYVIYYTGEYNKEKPDENYGLTFHAITKEKFDQDYDTDAETIYGEKIFEADGQQLVCFNKKTVKVPNLVNGTVSSAKVTKITVK